MVIIILCMRAVDLLYICLSYYDIDIIAMHTGFLAIAFSKLLISSVL